MLKLLLNTRVLFYRHGLWIGTSFGAPQLVLLHLGWVKGVFHCSFFDYYDYME